MKAPQFDLFEKRRPNSTVILTSNEIRKTDPGGVGPLDIAYFLPLLPEIFDHF